jgi:hypothetical protein
MTRINYKMQQTESVRSIFNQLSISALLVSADLFEGLNLLYLGDVHGVIADERGLSTR